MNHSPQGRGAWAGCRLAFKSFLPRFFTKKRAGSRGGALAARRSARNSLMLMKRRRGLKGEPSPGVPPLRAAPAARSPCAPPWGWRWTKERVVEDADPYGGWETGRAPHNMPRDHPTPGPGRAERGEAGKNRDGGTSRTPSPTGRLRRRGAGSNPASGWGRTAALGIWALYYFYALHGPNA